MSFYGNILNRVEEESFRVTMKDISSESDGSSAKWTFKQGNVELGTIDIPLQTILKVAEIVGENDKGDKGTFIKLTFRTEEETGTSDVYIDVTELANQPTVIDGVLKFTKG